MKTRVAGGVLCAVLAIGFCPGVYADDTGAVIQAHAVTPYPGTVRVNDTDPYGVYTKDPVDKVKKYFEAHLQKGDAFEPFQEQNEKGWRLQYHAVLEGKAQSVMEVELTEHVPDAELVGALGALKSQTLLGHHSEAVFQALEKKYKSLAKAYYRQVDDGNGHRLGEDALLYKQAEQEAFPEQDRQKALKASDAFTDKQARAKALKAQMKALKAKGDIAGMMKLAQELKLNDVQSQGVADVMAAGTQDTWDIWVKCLEATAKAAYWTKIQYHSSALPGVQ